MKFKKPPVRLWIGCMVFMITFTNYMIRSSMSVSIVAMVEKKDNKTHVSLCEKLNLTKTEPGAKKESPGTKYDWTAKEQSWILSGYFYGFLATSLPAGLITDYFGPYLTVIVTNVAIGALNSLTPFVVSTGWPVVFGIRIIIGMLGGLAYPSAQVLIARWAPPNEKGKFLAAMMGNTLGTVITWPLVGTISDELDWQWGFHVQTVVLAIFLIAYGLLVSNSPDTHKWISDEEKEYIRESQHGKVNTKKKIPPYWEIFKSVPFWAMTIAQFGNLWVLNVILTYAPKYLKKVMGFDLKASSGIAALPYLARLVCSSGFGIVGDWMRKTEKLSVTNIRRFFTIFSHFIPAALLPLIYAAKCNKVPVIAVLILNQAFNGAVVVGHLQNTQDLSPNFAGTLYGLFSFFGGTTGVFVPIISAEFETKFMAEKDVMGPGHLYTVAGVVMMVCGAIFIAFGSGEVQPWNEIPDKPPKEEPAKDTPTTS